MGLCLFIPVVVTNALKQPLALNGSGAKVDFHFYIHGGSQTCTQRHLCTTLCTCSHPPTSNYIHVHIHPQTVVYMSTFRTDNCTLLSSLIATTPTICIRRLTIKSGSEPTHYSTVLWAASPAGELVGYHDTGYHRGIKIWWDKDQG